MIKSFSTVRDTQRGAQSYMEKSKGRREIGVTRRRKGGIKSGKSKLAGNYFPMCSPQSATLREVHGEEKRTGTKETESMCVSLCMCLCVCVLQCLCVSLSVCVYFSVSFSGS